MRRVFVYALHCVHGFHSVFKTFCCVLFALLFISYLKFFSGGFLLLGKSSLLHSGFALADFRDDSGLVGTIGYLLFSKMGSKLTVPMMSKPFSCLGFYFDMFLIF